MACSITCTNTSLIPIYVKLNVKLLLINNIMNTIYNKNQQIICLIHYLFLSFCHLQNNVQTKRLLETFIINISNKNFKSKICY